MYVYVDVYVCVYVYVYVWVYVYVYVLYVYRRHEEDIFYLDFENGSWDSPMYKAKETYV